MEQEVNLKMTCIAIQTSEKASQAFLTALRKFNMRQRGAEHISSSNKRQNKEIGGKMVKVKDLRKDGSQIEFVDMGTNNLKDFRKYARNYGVSYSMEKNKATDPPTYLIYFKAKDGVLIDKAISAYVADKMASKDKDKTKGIAEKLILGKEKVASQPKKVRNKEHIR